ncbi:MAG: hypothetical protein ABFQ62_00620 [Patescibacteria group bacterium]
MKAIIIAPSLSGKTSIIKYLQENYDFNVSEMDEELTKINNGKFPEDAKSKHDVLAFKVIKQILLLKDIIFFTNTNYFSDQDLIKAKELGFKIIQLDLSIEELRKRNKKRMENEGYDDMSRWLDGMVEYQENIFEKGFVDRKISAVQPASEAVKDLLDYTNTKK